MRFRIIASSLAVILPGCRFGQCQGFTGPETGKDSQDGSQNSARFIGQWRTPTFKALQRGEPV